MRLTWVLIWMGGSIAQISAAQAQTPPATAPTTTTRPTSRAEPLAQPVTAVEYLISVLKKEDFSAIREVNLQQATTSELREVYGPAIKQLRAGGKIVVVDSNKSGTCAMVICRLIDRNENTQSVFSLITIQRFDQWKVEWGKPNLLRMTRGERDTLIRLAEWSQSRLKELRTLWIESTTKPAAVPAAGNP